MKKTRRIEITLQTERRVALRAGGVTLAHCAACARLVHMATPEQAALLAGLSARTVYQRVEAGQLHFAETTDGWLLICLESLANLEPTELKLRREQAP